MQGTAAGAVVRTMPSHQVAATVKHCVQAARAGVARRVEEILRAAAPGDPLTDELIAKAHKAFPQPFEVLSQVRWCLTHAKTFVKFLIVAINHFGAKIPLVIEAFKTVANIIPKLNGV